MTPAAITTKTMKPFNKKIIIALALTVMVIAIGMATTAQAFTFQTKWPTSPMGTDIYHDANPTLAKGIKYVYEWGVGLGGVAVFIVLVMAGFQYITSVGDPTKMKDAFKRIEDAVIGLLILLSSYAILNMVGINLKSLKMGNFDQLAFDSPVIACTSAEGDTSAPECCTNKDGSAIPNCDSHYYSCIKGTCQLKTTFTKCTRAKVIYTDGTADPMSTFDEQEVLDTSATIASMELYYGPGDNDRCFDPTDNNANKSTNPACACGLQLFTKTSTTSTGGWLTNPCENNTDQAFANNNDTLKYYTKGKRVVCVMLTQPATSIH